MNINLETVIQAAKAGGAVIRHYFGEVLEVEEKSGANDLRTKADIESEQAVLAILCKAFPEANIYAEESGEIQNDSEYTFVIDPLDGTTNFVQGIPYFSVSIGLLRGDDAILGVIYNPITDQLFTARKGQGAFMNGKQLHVNRETELRRTTVSYTCGYRTSREYSEQVKARLRTLPVKRILDHWAPAYDYCLLAAGRIEAVISKEGDFEDHAAAGLIVTEAGGRVTGLDGQPVNARANDLVASNGTALHDQIRSAL